jgi:hypothetical protein
VTMPAIAHSADSALTVAQALQLDILAGRGWCGQHVHTTGDLVGVQCERVGLPQFG